MLSHVVPSALEKPNIKTFAKGLQFPQFLKITALAADTPSAGGV